MSKLVGLEQYYPGDEAWRRFVECAPNGLEEFSGARALETALSGNKEIAAIVYAILGAKAIEWVQSPKDMLDGISPAECVSEQRLLRRLRTMLMRMGGR